MATSQQRSPLNPTEKIFGRIAACATLIALCLSYGLWTCNRLYSTVPITPALQGISQSCAALPFYSLIALLLLAAFFPSRLVFASYVLVGLCWGLLDQNRLQPWFFQSLLFFLALSAPKGRLELCRFILAATYFWSGVQKINASFVLEVFPWMLSSFTDVSFAGTWMDGVAMTLPLVELSLGLMLLFRRTTRLAASGIIAMHATILACIGPFGHVWNLVVWPWNLEMCALCSLLFLSSRAGLLEARACVPKDFVGLMITVLVGLMPALNFVGLWDSYLSFALYSGNTIEAAVIVPVAESAKLAPELLELAGPSASDPMRIEFADWSLSELGVPSYPAERLFRFVASSLCQRAGVGANLELELRDPPPLNATKRERRTLSCARLQ